jgi:hypothetical protein
MKVLNDLQTHRSCKRTLTGSLHRISTTRSNGRVSSSGGLKERKSEGKSDVRVLIKVLKCFFFVVVVAVFSIEEQQEEMASIRSLFRRFQRIMK